MEESVISLTPQLIAIDSVNPSLVPDGAGEAAIARFIAGWLDARGFAVQIVASQPDRPSVIGVYRGRGGGRSLLLNGHIDTVTLAGYDGDPLQPLLREGRLHGRGSYDMKSGVAALLIAAAAASRMALGGDVIVTCVADEEHSSQGTQEVLRHVRADAAIVTEPTELALVTAHKGFVWATITTAGVAAHGSRPDLGVDAIVKMGRVLERIDQLDQRLRAHPTHPLLGSGSIHASLISGGAERSSYPAACVLDVERRTVPGETPAIVQRELEELIAACAHADPQFQAAVALGLARGPFETPPDAPILGALRTSAAAVLGAEPLTHGVSYWADAALLHAQGIPTVMFGAAGSGAHAAHEYVDVASLEQLTAILTQTIATFCA